MSGFKVGEKGKEAMDSVLKNKMNISDEQAEADAAKIKALRTSVGWFSSHACSLIYQVHHALALPLPLVLHLPLTHPHRQPQPNPSFSR